MTAYLLTFRAAAGYKPLTGTFQSWCAWQLSLRARLKDRGNIASAATTLGASPATTTLGGYSLIRAGGLDEAVDVASGGPILQHGGAVELAEVANHHDVVDQWLIKHMSGQP